MIVGLARERRLHILRSPALTGIKAEIRTTGKLPD